MSTTASFGYRFASLGAGLLARKGAAEPAMGGSSGGMAPELRAETPKPPVMPAPAPQRLPVAPVEMRDPPAAACPAGEGGCADPARRFHVNVRLKQQHFVRLKIASAQLRKPSQDLVADALTQYFSRLDPAIFGPCACARDL